MRTFPGDSRSQDPCLPATAERGLSFSRRRRRTVQTAPDRGRPAEGRPAGSADSPAPTWSRSTALLRRLVRRDAVDAVVDRIRFHVDTFPFGLYQPVSSLPGGRATRARGSESRWDAILPVLEANGVGNAVDIGACEGYFSLMLAEAGVSTIALEGKPSNYRTTLYAVRRSGLTNIGVLALRLTPENVDLVPSADCVLCLSIWHHFVRTYGLEVATAMLQAIWRKTGVVMFFDTGETEMTPDYRLPEMTPDPRAWLEGYLSQTCAGSRIGHLGRHLAFDPEGGSADRNLFAVVRTAELTPRL